MQGEVSPNNRASQESKGVASLENAPKALAGMLSLPEAEIRQERGNAFSLLESVARCTAWKQLGGNDYGFQVLVTMDYEPGLGLLEQGLRSWFWKWKSHSDRTV